MIAAEARRSAAYEGVVFHKRLRPKAHAFRYRVFSLLVDLDELPDLDRGLRLFSRNRWNLFSFRDRDHGTGDPQTLAGWVHAQLRTIGVAIPSGRVAILCYPRILGYVFNPLSVYFCRRADGSLAALIYEVNNTFGERHAYVLPAQPESGASVRHDCAKAFHVSPFMAMARRYAWSFTPPGEDLRVHMDVRDGETREFDATLALQRRTLDAAGLARVLWRYPLMTAQVSSFPATYFSTRSWSPWGQSSRNSSCGGWAWASVTMKTPTLDPSATGLMT